LKVAHVTGAVMQANSPTSDYVRPASIEEATNRLVIHPLSGMVASGALRFGLSANQLSVAGLLCGWAAAGFYFFQPDRKMVIAGFLAMAAWHIFDGADGRVARATGTSSAIGRIIDGICDHLVFAAVYIAITISMIFAGASPLIWIIVIAAGVSHAVQAAAYEERRQIYQRRSSGVTRDDANKKLLHVDGNNSVIALIYDRIQRLASSKETPLDEALLILRKRHDSGDILQSVANRTALIVRRWSILNANNRTIMITLACFVGRPIFYFVYELVILNMILLCLLIYEQRVENGIYRDIAPIAGMQ
jgi:CDP-diacylglycerol---serine O-phosphatidyltransferase